MPGSGASAASGGASLVVLPDGSIRLYQHPTASEAVTVAHIISDYPSHALFLDNDNSGAADALSLDTVVCTNQAYILRRTSARKTKAPPSKLPLGDSESLDCASPAALSNALKGTSSPPATSPQNVADFQLEMSPPEDLAARSRSARRATYDDLDFGPAVNPTRRSSSGRHSGTKTSPTGGGSKASDGAKKSPRNNIPRPPGGGPQGGIYFTDVSGALAFGGAQRYRSASPRGRNDGWQNMTWQVPPKLLVDSPTARTAATSGCHTASPTATATSRPATMQSEAMFTATQWQAGNIGGDVETSPASARRSFLLSRTRSSSFNTTSSRSSRSFGSSAFTSGAASREDLSLEEFGVAVGEGEGHLRTRQRSKTCKERSNPILEELHQMDDGPMNLEDIVAIPLPPTLTSSSPTSSSSSSRVKTFMSKIASATSQAVWRRTKAYPSPDSSFAPPFSSSTSTSAAAAASIHCSPWNAAPTAYYSQMYPTEGAFRQMTRHLSDGRSGSPWHEEGQQMGQHQRQHQGHQQEQLHHHQQQFRQRMTMEGYSGECGVVGWEDDDNGSAGFAVHGRRVSTSFQDTRGVEGGIGCVMPGTDCEEDREAVLLSLLTREQQKVAAMEREFASLRSKSRSRSRGEAKVVKC